MFGGGFLFDTLIVAVVVAAGLVAARLMLCGVLAARSRQKWILALSVAGILAVGLLFGALVAMWFAYAVAHTGKDMSTFVRMLLVTGVPYILGLVALWLGGGVLASRLRSGSRRQGPASEDRQPSD